MYVATIKSLIYIK